MQLMKAIAAGALGALMAGSTLAFAATLADFPAPFVSGSTVNTLVVVGASAQTDDVVGAVDLAARLGGVPATDQSVTCAGTSGGVTVTNGVRLDTGNTKIRLGDQLTTAKDTLTSADLSTVLASGSVLDTSGNEYKYDQYISLGSNPRVGFNNPTSTPSTPDVVLDAGGITSTQAWYSAKIIFQKPLAGSITSGSSTNIDGRPIKLFGQDYTLGSGTTELTNTTITLYGGGTEVGLDWTGTPVTQSVTVGGKTISITLNGITADSPSKADMTIDGTSYLSEPSSYITTASGLRIYVKTVVRYGQGGTGRVVLKVGADKLKLSNGQTVKVGSTEETVPGTLVTITTQAGTNYAVVISSIQIDVFPPDAEKQRIAAGTDFIDPVFKSFKLRLEGVSPALSATTRDITTVSYNGDAYAQVTFTDYRGTTKSITIGNVITGTSEVNLTDGTYRIHVNENETIAPNEYTIINQGGFSHLLQYTSNDLTSTTSPSVTLRDVISGTDYKVYLTNSNGTAIIDGKSYFVRNESTSILVHRGTTFRTGSATSPYALYTPLKLKNGEELVITKPIAFTNGTYYVLPGNNTISGGEGWHMKRLTNDTNTTFLAGTVNYTIQVTPNHNLIYPTGMNLTGTNSVGVIIIEERDASGARNSINIPITTSQVTGTIYRITVSTPTQTGEVATPSDSSLVQTSDSYTQKGLDIYGALVTYQGTSGTGQHKVTVSYPDDQIIADVMMGGLDMVVSTTGATAGQTVTYSQVVPIKTAIAKLDSEVTEADKTTKNLILVGGPCVNTLVASLATAGKFDYTCSGWPGRNFGLIKIVNDAFVTGKAALVVAGTRAADTRAATSRLQQYDVAGLTPALTGTSVEVTA